MAEQSSRRAKVPALVADGRFVIQRRLGAGCFGEVYRGVDQDTGDVVAVKTEDLSRRCHRQLAHEADILALLRCPELPQGFVNCHYFGREDSHNCMVIELLGWSLEDRARKCGGKFSPKTTLLVASQVLQRIEYMHSKGIVHRDIKPENFMLGIGDKEHHIYVIDFGLSKKYWDKKHVSMKTRLSLTGTARYASINAHRGVEQSRRDDLEAIGHMLLYFLRGKLPWSGLEAKTSEEKCQKILEKKENFPLAELCAAYPGCFQAFLRHARGLAFTACPDYDMLRNLIAGDSKKEGIRNDFEFEWFEGQDWYLQVPENLVPIKREKFIQPDVPDLSKAPSPEIVARRQGLFCVCGGQAAKSHHRVQGQFAKSC